MAPPGDFKEFLTHFDPGVKPTGANFNTVFCKIPHRYMGQEAYDEAKKKHADEVATKPSKQVGVFHDKVAGQVEADENSVYFAAFYMESSRIGGIWM